MEAAPPDLQVTWRADLKNEQRGRLVKSATLNKAAERIALALAGVINAKGRVSMYLPFRFDVNLLQQCASPEILKQFRDRDVRLLNQLVDVNMPRLESLDPKEILAVRRGDEFEQWRGSLRSALENASQLPADLLNRREEMRKVVDEQLAEGRTRLDRAIAKSPLLAGLRKGTITMLAGNASALVVYFITHNSILSLEAALAGGLTAATIQGMAEALGTQTATDVERVLLGHYVAAMT